MDMYQRVDEAVQRGDAWRAKEILRGNIASGSYDSQLYERYGTLLMELGELVEAGKYLFLSGRRSPEYARAIVVYLSRYPADRPDVLYHSFPSAARFGQDRLSLYPLEVRRALQERGLPEYFEELHRQRLERHRQRKRVYERAHEQMLLREGWAGPSSVFRVRARQLQAVSRHCRSSPSSGAGHPCAWGGPGGRGQRLPGGRHSRRRGGYRSLGRVAAVGVDRALLRRGRRYPLGHHESGRVQGQAAPCRRGYTDALAGPGAGAGEGALLRHLRHGRARLHVRRAAAWDGHGARVLRHHCRGG